MPEDQGKDLTILNRGVFKNQEVYVEVPIVAGHGVNWPGKIIGADFEKRTVMVKIEVPAHRVREKE